MCTQQGEGTQDCTNDSKHGGGRLEQMDTVREIFEECEVQMCVGFGKVRSNKGQ